VEGKLADPPHLVIGQAAVNTNVESMVHTLLPPIEIGVYERKRVETRFYRSEVTNLPILKYNEYRLMRTVDADYHE
jgi:hypothetical protein